MLVVIPSKSADRLLKQGNCSLLVYDKLNRLFNVPNQDSVKRAVLPCNVYIREDADQSMFLCVCSFHF